MTWLDRLAARFGYTRREYARVDNGIEAVARGQRWEAFYAEVGGLHDMLLKIRRGYFEAAAGLSVSDRDKLYEYALADRLARELDREVRTIIETGKLRAHDAEQAKLIANLAR